MLKSFLLRSRNLGVGNRQNFFYICIKVGQKNLFLPRALNFLKFVNLLILSVVVKQNSLKKISWNWHETRLCDFNRDRDLHDLVTFTPCKLGYIIVSKKSEISRLLKQGTHHSLKWKKNGKKVKKTASRWRKFFDMVQTTRLTKRQTFWSWIEERIKQSGWLLLLPFRSILLQWLDAGHLSDKESLRKNASISWNFKVLHPDLNQIHTKGRQYFIVCWL